MFFFADVSRNEKAREVLRRSFETAELESVFLMEFSSVCAFPKFRKMRFLTI